VVRADASVGKIWTWVTVPTFIFCLGLWVRTQAKGFKLVDYIAGTRPQVAVLGLFASIPILLSLWLARKYAKQHARLKRAHRLPAPMKEWPDGDTGDKLRVVIAVAMICVMASSQIHFLDILLSSDVFLYRAHPDSSTVPAIHGGYLQMLSVWPPCGWCADTYRLGDARAGPTYFPSYESWLFLVLVIAALTLTIHYLFVDFRIQKQ
jgi:hypothetical protein